MNFARRNDIGAITPARPHRLCWRYLKPKPQSSVGLLHSVAAPKPLTPHMRVDCGEGRRTDALERAANRMQTPSGYRHSDKEKFCNDLNELKTLKVSERPLKTLQDFLTSKLNTRVRFPSPAPAFSKT